MWRRLPTWFPNLRLQMLPLTDEQKAAVAATGWLREVAFKCEPRTTKVRVAVVSNQPTHQHTVHNKPLLQNLPLLTPAFLSPASSAAVRQSCTPLPCPAHMYPCLAH